MNWSQDEVCLRLKRRLQTVLGEMTKEGSPRRNSRERDWRQVREEEMRGKRESHRLRGSK